ncbi:MAG: hypothetical protein IGS48_08445 [Oscillatoriales cyanobacterium C42_A2020_001]|nr:hypothetical protein [Leptolyngbyaceae cyanobacterium C42_A2020_001]
MTQSGENDSRLDRIEAILLDLAVASVRHDNAISRHDQEFSRISNTLQELAEAQKRTEEQQQANAQQIAQNQQAIAQLTAEQQLSRQDINTLTASIQDLRNLVADYLQRRS